MSRTALLLINPLARSGRDAVAAVTAALRERGMDVLHDPAAPCERFPELIGQLASRCDMVVVGGGDGTINACLQGLMACNPSRPLGIVPLGTANDAARSLGVPEDVAAAADVIAAGRVRQIDVASVNGHYFINAASVGLSVEITQIMTHESKQTWGPLAYALAGIKALSRSRGFSAEMAVDGNLVAVKTVQIVVGNGRYFGAGMTVDQEATMWDGLLHGYSVGVQRWWSMFAMLPALKQGRHAWHWSVFADKGRRIELRTRRPMPVNTDGEIFTQTPAVFEVHPNALAVFVPVINQSVQIV